MQCICNALCYEQRIGSLTARVEAKLVIWIGCCENGVNYGILHTILLVSFSEMLKLTVK